MANSSSTGFGLKPIKMYGNGYENMGLGEYPVAASSSAIYNQDLVCQAATGFVVVGTAGTEDIIGSLNGIFYTDATTNKPTFQNYLQGSNTASDIVALVNDSPIQQYEVEVITLERRIKLMLVTLQTLHIQLGEVPTIYQERLSMIRLLTIMLTNNLKS
jgi:hypothetical protein